MTPRSFVDVLAQQAQTRPDNLAFTYVQHSHSGEQESRLTYSQLEVEARRIAALLRLRTQPGDRAVMLYPYADALQFVCAFFGCLFAGVIAVPAYPRDPMRPAPTLRRLGQIATDATPSVVLMSTALTSEWSDPGMTVPELASTPVIVTDDRGATAEPLRQEDVVTSSVAFLQYTSGSTASPKGVIVPHDSVLANARAISSAMRGAPDAVNVGWVPLYHDMGLIGNVLTIVLAGGHCVLLSPMHVLQQPARWLRAIMKYRATHSGGPNFMYDLCEKRIPIAQRASFDLRSWTVAFSGAERVQAATLERFAVAFEPSGFNRRAFLPCFGLAEATLMVTASSEGARTMDIDARAYRAGVGRTSTRSDEETSTVVSCGTPPEGTCVLIVDPASGVPCETGVIGEIWVAGPGVASGYWNRPEETAQCFGARARGRDEAFLRTGDEGFADGEGRLYVAGRIKDLVIIAGRNIHPEDVEVTVQECDPAVRHGGVAAFPWQVEGQERLGIMAAIDPKETVRHEAIFAHILRRVTQAHQVAPHYVALVRPSSVRKTSSGKIQRRTCREALEAGAVDLLAEWWNPSERDGRAAAPPSRGAVAQGGQLGSSG